MQLSERQQAILDYIRAYWRGNQRPPTIREIQEHLGISSTSVVNYNLNRLADEGLIVRAREVSRGIRLVDDSGMRLAQDILVRVPISGYIRAGAPVDVPDASVAPDEYLELTRDLVKGEGDVFALRVRGDSMIDALVNDGDIVLMQQVPRVNNGEMVAAWLKNEQETTLKKFYLEGNRVRLQPANPTMEPIYTTPANVQIQGKVIVVIRQVA
ncbi:MAG: repressor LexA [Chloroflexi bacterium]|nr:repressor LexA [Chloroflexota bacterium]